MFREPDLIDVWFDSGAMPYAQWHYPFENEETFKKNFPADFIAEGVDQTRGWFYTLHALGVLLHDSVAYKTVVSNGLVLDKDGNKMSKRVGNVVDPIQIIEQFGAATFKDNVYNAGYISSIVFKDEEKLALLNSIIHPYVFYDWDMFCNQNKQHPIVIKEAAIMLETESKNTVDKIALVHAPLELRIQRVMARDHITEEALKDIQDGMTIMLGG